jgi:hypothetical protein
VTAPWEPANEAERALAQALAAGDQREFFRVLSTVDLYLPQLAADSGADGVQAFITAVVFERTFLPVFTSVETMARQVAGVADSYTVTNYAELRSKWPSDQWRLAINGGSPLEAYLPVEAVEEAAAGRSVIPNAIDAFQELAVDDLVAEIEAAGQETAAGEPADLEADFEAAMARRSATDEPFPDVDELLSVAAGQGDSVGYLNALLDAVVVVPVARDVDDPTRILEVDFPWRPVGTPPARSIEVFTSDRLFAQAYPDPVPSVTVSIVLLLTVWPEGYGLSVNPGSEWTVDLPSDQVRSLLLWPSTDRG